MYTMRGEETPKCASAPRPRPSTPMPCASSRTSQASWRSASARSSGTGATSPSMLKTASVAITRVADFEAASSARQPAEIAVRITTERRAREQRAVVQARVVQPVGEDGRAAVRDRREDAEIRGVAAGKEERARQAREARKGRLGLLVQLRVPDRRWARRRRRSRSRRWPHGPLPGRGDDWRGRDSRWRRSSRASCPPRSPRVPAASPERADREAARRDAVLPARAARAASPACATAAPQPAVRPRVAKSASSRSTSGLPVVRSFSP